MRCSESLKIAAILLPLSFTCIGVSLAAEVAVCTLPSDQINPDVSRNYVVWEDHRTDLSRIYLYDINAGTAAPIANPRLLSSQSEPSIDGDAIVYVSHGKLGDEIDLYSIQDGTTTTIRASAERLEKPDVYSAGGGVSVVWTEYVQNDEFGAPNSEIWLYRKLVLGIATIKQVSDGGYESDPRISGMDIVWMHKTEVPGLDAYHGPYDIYAVTTSGGTPMRISTTTAGERNLFPDVSAGRVVWQAHPETDGYGSVVLLSSLPADAGDPVTRRPAPSETPEATLVCRQPSVSGEAVVYVSSDLNAGEDTLMVVEPESDIDYSLSLSTDVSSPRIDGQTVVWQDRRAGNGDIYLATTGPRPVTGCTVIDEPGYYVLAKDIVDLGCSNGIDIRCSNVLLDCQGNMVDGQDEAETAGIMIAGATSDPYTLNALSNVNVRNVRLSDWAAGIYGSMCSNSTFSNVSASSGADGLVTDGYCAANALLSSSISYNSGDGVRDADWSSLDIVGCTIARNGGNGVFAYTSGLKCRDSLIAENGGDGFDIERAGCTLHNNTIRDNADAGIEFYNVGSVTCTIEGNTITGNAIGIADKNYYGGGRTIYNNRFNNTVNADSDATNAWSVAVAPGRNIVGGPSIGGNYWAQPDGLGFSQTHSDSDHDGFCDKEYVVTTADEGFTESIDYFPLRRPASGIFHPFPGILDPPQDIHLDGKYEDVNGNGLSDFADIVLYFNNLTWIAENEPVTAFDYNGNGRIDFADVVWLFNHL